VATDETIRGAGSKQWAGDIRMGQPQEQLVE